MNVPGFCRPAAGYLDVLGGCVFLQCLRHERGDLGCFHVSGEVAVVGFLLAVLDEPALVSPSEPLSMSSFPSPIM